MRARVVRSLAGREVRSALRARWFLVGAVSFAVLACAVSRLGMGESERWGVSTFDRTTAALLNLVLLFVPLLALPVGASSFANDLEDGMLAYLVAQPVTRAEVFTGKLVGLIGAMSLASLLGFGAAALLVGAGGGVALGTFGVLVAGAWALSVVTVALGSLLALAGGNRVRALTAAIGAWITLVFLCDFGVLALAATQTLGPEALFLLSIANPLQAVKTMIALAVSARLEVLGPAGTHAVHMFGRLGLATLLGASTFAWLLGSASAAAVVFRRTDLT